VELHLGHRQEGGSEIRSKIQLADGVYDNPAGAASETTRLPAASENAGAQVLERDKRLRTNGGRSNQSNVRKAASASAPDAISGQRETETVTR